MTRDYSKDTFYRVKSKAGAWTWLAGETDPIEYPPDGSIRLNFHRMSGADVAAVTKVHANLRAAIGAGIKVTCPDGVVNGVSDLQVAEAGSQYSYNAKDGDGNIVGNFAIASFFVQTPIVTASATSVADVLAARLRARQQSESTDETAPNDLPF